MPQLQRKSLREPEEVRRLGNGRVDIVSLGETVFGLFHLEAGWRWSTDVRPVVGTNSCQNRHLGYCISGRFRIEMDDGAAMDFSAGDAFEIPPGHDGWVVGDDQWVVIEFTSTRVFGLPPEETGNRVLATILFTDIVGSTAHLEHLGDATWRDLLLRHNERMRAEFDRYRGREVGATGDGFLALFDAPARAVRCGAAMARVARDLGVEIRVGAHTGEVELVAGDARGVAVHAAARLMALAGAGEVFVSSTTRDLLDGSGLQLESRGRFELRGLTGRREVFRLVADEPERAGG